MKNDPSISKNSITLIYRGNQSGLWIGTFEGDLNRYIPESNSFNQFNMSTEINLGRNNNGIFSMYEDKDGILWIGTYGGGLNRLDIINNTVKSYTEQNGLPNNVIYSVLPDKAGNLWLSTNRGISKFNPTKETFRNYDVKDGLQSNEFNQGAYFVSNGGELFFGGVNGFNAFFPEEIVDNNFIPPVHIITVKVFDKTLSLPDPVTTNIKQFELSYFQNFFSFEFVALNYTSPDKNNYAYMLDGFDKDWHIAPATNRYASYTNLDPGEYVLRVKGSNNDNIWNETGTSITIIVTPPFWMTWWFRGLMIITIIVIGGSTIRYFILKNIKERTRKMEQETALERERLRIARDMHDDLGSRLTEIRLLSEMAYKEQDSRKTSAALCEVSEIARNIISTFSEIVWSVNPQNDTVENLAEYIGQYAVDYLSKAEIKCRLDFPQEFPLWKASSEVRHNTLLAVKEALNNAVKHSDAKEINVKVKVESRNGQNIAALTIQDYGKGFDLNAIQMFSNGLKNMKKRMEQYGGKFEINSKTGSGTTLTFIIPLIS